MASLLSDEVMSGASNGDGGGNADVSRRRSSSNNRGDREEEIRELLKLLEQKDADLRAAAQLGKGCTKPLCGRVNFSAMCSFGKGLLC